MTTIIGVIIKGNFTKPRQAALGGHFLSEKGKENSNFQWFLILPKELDRVADDLTVPRADCTHGQRQPCSKKRRLERGM